MFDLISVKIKETADILKELGYKCEIISSKEFYDYMTAYTPTGDTITLEEVLQNKFLIVHEVVEISELKKMGVPINKNTILQFYSKVYEAHLTALDYELTYADSIKNYKWLKQRFKNFQSQLNEKCLPQKFNNLEQKLALKCKSIIEKFSKYLY